MGEEKVKLRREINFIHATTIMAGIVIGSGIFVSPVAIIRQCQSIGLSLVIWGVSGVITIFIAISYAELGAMFPRAGGEYAYFKEILGPLPAFLNVWMQFLTIKPCFFAILSLTTANYLFYPVFPDCDMPPLATKLFAAWILSKYISLLNINTGSYHCIPRHYLVYAIFVYMYIIEPCMFSVSIVVVNSLFVRYVTRTQTFFTVLKVLTLIVIIVTGLIVIAKGRHQSSNQTGTCIRWMYSVGVVCVHVFDYCNY